MNQIISTLICCLLLLSSSCQNLTEISTVVKPVSAEDSDRIEDLKMALEQRAKKMNFKGTTIEIEEEKNLLTLTAKVDLETQTGLTSYRSIFGSNTLGLWETYRVSDPAISQHIIDIPSIEGFKDFRQFTMGYFPAEMLGVCQNETLLPVILDTLNYLLADVPNLKLLWSVKQEDNYSGVSGFQLYLINTNGLQEALINDTHITESFAAPNSYSMEPQILFSMNEEGTRLWSEVTKKAANNDNRSIAIVINDRVYSVPRVMAPIDAGKCAISGAFSLSKADEIASAIGLGRLPFPIEIVEETINKKENSND